MTKIEDRAFETLNENPDKLLEVLKRRGGIRVSILLPITKETGELRQNASRLKNLYKEALDKLLENGLSQENAEAFLQPVRPLLNDSKSLYRPAESLVFLIDGQSASVVDIHDKSDSLVSVGNRFIIKPLLPLVQNDSAFTVVCLSLGRVRVYAGTRMAIREIEVPDMPTSLKDAIKFDDPEKSLQHHTAKTEAASGRPGQAPVAAMHGQGLPSDLERP